MTALQAPPEPERQAPRRGGMNQGGMNRGGMNHGGMNHGGDCPAHDQLPSPPRSRPGNR